LGHYEYARLDIAHVVAATALIGAVIYQFDEPGGDGAMYLRSVDAAAFSAAVDAFPEFQDGPRLFPGDSPIADALSTLYKEQLTDGVVYLSENLPAALGWF
jgi:hypothetical protein